MSLSINDEYKFVELQMAAEAFLVDKNNNVLVEDELLAALKVGNKHASKFSEEDAKNFLSHWEIVSQAPNTDTGFSGTLFRCKEDDPATGAKKGELVMSFRSTEFIDDAVRDNQQTNTYEIKDTGWAWGQIRDMEAWYASLKTIIES